MGLLERIRSGTFVPDDGPALSTPGRRLTLREAGARIERGEDLLLVVREFLDQAGRVDAPELAAMIGERPELTGNTRADALIAAVAEHLAAVREIRCPA